MVLRTVKDYSSFQWILGLPPAPGPHVQELEEIRLVHTLGGLRVRVTLLLYPQSRAQHCTYQL